MIETGKEQVRKGGLPPLKPKLNDRETAGVNHPSLLILFLALLLVTQSWLVIEGAAVTNVHAGAPVVTKVEPPTWWANHTINPVRLLVRGQNLLGAQLLSSTRAIRPSNIRTNEAG